MIYIETNKNNEIIFTHLMPFSAEYGLNKSKEELEKTGYLIESIPEEPEEKKGKRIIKYYNQDSKEIYYKYIDVKEEKIIEEKNLEDRVEALEKSNAELMNLMMMQTTPTK